MKNIFLLIGFCLLIIVGITSYRNSKKEKSLVVIMMGPPGAGKGTHAAELSKSLNLPHISTGDLFRDNIKRGTILGKKAKELIEKGSLVPDEIVIDMLFSHIKENGYNKGYILDGFPRTINQAKALDKKLSKNAKKIALNLNIDDSFLIDRITGRLICRNCSTPFHKTFLKPKVEGKCDKCEGELYQRKDDIVEVVKRRLEVYHRETEPLLEFYQKQKALHEVDSNKSKEIVFDNILKTIEKPNS